jgi:hypothetical protein
VISLHGVGKLKTWIGSTEAEFMNAQFVDVSGQNLECFQAGGFRIQCLHFKPSFKPLLHGGWVGGGLKSGSRGESGDCE